VLVALPITTKASSFLSEIFPEFIRDPRVGKIRAMLSYFKSCFFPSIFEKFLPPLNSSFIGLFRNWKRERPFLRALRENPCGIQTTGGRGPISLGQKETTE
jgi:hypothetical protein